MLSRITSLFGLRPSSPSLEVSRVANSAEYRAHLQAMRQTHDSRWVHELALSRGNEPIITPGICYACNKSVDLVTDFSHCATLADGTRVPNWREHVTCPCGLSNRARAAVHIVEAVLGAKRHHSMYIAEQVTPLYRTLAKRYPSLIGSEYLGKAVPFGELNTMGIRNESITQLCFEDASFDYALNFDVLEHIPDPMKGLSELYRVLKPNGYLLLSVPFMPDHDISRQRARVDADGNVEHLLEPHYHGDPVSDAGCLCFQDFGWDLLDQMRETGFRRAEVILYWSAQFGYYGVEQMMIVARK
jgi:hypothetical protein